MYELFRPAWVGVIIQVYGFVYIVMTYDILVIDHNQYTSV